MTTRQHISNEEFFSALSALFSTHASSARGSIFLTQKRMPSTSTSESTETDPSTTGAGSILVRASNGKHKSFKKKLSTIVAAGDVDAFYARYAEICKSGMTAMKKRDRSAKKKGKGKKEKKAA